MIADWRIVVGANGRLPTRAHVGDAGYDLYVANSAILRPNATKVLDLNLRIQPADGWWFRITGRSSARRRGLHVHEAIIDNGYTGPLYLVITNVGPGVATISLHDRLAQLIPHELHNIVWHQADDLKPTQRGDNGLGSTGR